MPNAAVGKLFVAAEGAGGGGGGGGAALCLITTFLDATILDSMIFFSQNKPPLVFSEGVILNLIGYCGVFLIRGFFSAGALIAAGFFTKVRFFFSGAAGGSTVTGTGVVAAGGSGTYGIGVVAAGGSNLYGAWGTGMGHPGCPGFDLVTASKG